MKRTLALFLSLLMALTLCACGGGDTGSFETPTFSLGDTVSTDICDLTLENCLFTHYIYSGLYQPIGSNYHAPTNDPNNAYAAKVGHCFVSMTFAVENKDRAGSFSMGENFVDWRLEWTLSYNGEDYPVKSYFDSTCGLLASAAIIHSDGTVTGNSYSSATPARLSAGNSIKLRVFGVVDVDPENLTDGFDFTVNVLNSKDEYEYFTYTIPSKQ